MALKRFAGNYLYNLAGEYCRTCIVSLDADTHTLQSYQPFDGTEQPATEWLGGCFILSTKKQIPNLTKKMSLRDVMETLQGEGTEIGMNQKRIQQTTIREDLRSIYVWHTSVTQFDAVAEDIRRL